MADSSFEYLAKRFEEVAPMDYYREVFPIGSLEKKGEYKQGEYCGIAITISDEGKAWRTHITDSLEQLPSLIDGEEFTMMAPISYAGKRATVENARWLYALEFDLDFIRLSKNGVLVGMDDLLYQTSISEPDPFNRLPRPTYIIASSERNLHIVYLLEKPLAMYANVANQIRQFRKAFIPKLWDSYITDSCDSPQYEISPVQAFRLCGSRSKDKHSKVRCFRTGERISIETMNNYVPQDSQIASIQYKSNCTIEEAKELFPDWYERRIVQKLPARTWQAHRGLYDWWKRRLPEVKVGHRYHYLMCLCSYAVKCGISQEELTRDVMEHRQILDRISPPDNPLTVSDAMKALQSATEVSRYMKRETASKLSGLEIKPSKRNGRTKEQHMKYLNGMNAVRRSMGEEFATGRPTKKDLVFGYLREHPSASVGEIALALGISRNTARKWARTWREGKAKPV